jgi:hypothetical protein
MQNIIMMRVFNAECHNYVHYAKCHYVECHYAECHGARFNNRDHSLHIERE